MSSPIHNHIKQIQIILGPQFLEVDTELDSWDSEFQIQTQFFQSKLKKKFIQTSTTCTVYNREAYLK